VATDDDLRSRWRRWQLSRASFNWWVWEAVIGAIFVVLGLVSGSGVLTVLGLVVVLASLYTIYRRWRGRPPPNKDAAT
jgi:membrane-bound ClpP family serine protease